MFYIYPVTFCFNLSKASFKPIIKKHTLLNPVHIPGFKLCPNCLKVCLLFRWHAVSQIRFRITISMPNTCFTTFVFSSAAVDRQIWVCVSTTPF